jgi:ComF family protein
LLPGECLLCRGSVAAEKDDPLICGLCRCRWVRLPEPLCPRCGQPRLLTELACRLCTGWPDGLFRVRSAVWHDGGARDAVHQLKYEGWWRVADAMARAMVRLEPLTGRLVLVPVPLAVKRLRIRGYNQSDHLAAALGRLLGVEFRPAALRRVRETPTQTALTPEERLANVRGAFAARGIKGLRIILVDDVFTTGATLVAAASALMDAGAITVEAVTFARAKPAL